jgi:L-2-hydroxyglutarate oxidase
VIAAVEETEVPVLQQIFQRGKLNGLTGVEILDAVASKEAEPHVKAVESLWVPQAGIIDFGLVAREISKQLLNDDVSFYYDHAITEIRHETHHVVVSTTYGNFQASLFINCCGLYADRVATLTGMTGRYKILPFRGEFYSVGGTTAGRVRHLIYPVPDSRFPFLGVHFTPRLDGSVEAGPNAVLAFAREGYRLLDINAGECSEILAYSGFHRMALRYWRKGWEEMQRSFSKEAFLKSARRLVPSVQMQDMRYSRAGVRAQCVGSNGEMIHDYVILEDERVINLINTPSPAATSALSIGEFVAQNALVKLS